MACLAGTGERWCQLPFGYLNGHTIPLCMDDDYCFCIFSQHGSASVAIRAKTYRIHCSPAAQGEPRPGWP